MGKPRKTIEDVICAIQEALDIAEEIGDAGEDGYDQDARQAAIDAISMIRRGAYDDAIITIQREFLPKWADQADCEAAYKEAMG